MLLVKDNMRKESKRFLIIATVCLLLSVLTPIAYVLNANTSSWDFIKICLMYAIFGVACLFMWVSAKRYELLITQERAIIRTMFRKYEIDLHNVMAYTCKRYRKSEFYQFTLVTENKKIMVSTHYKEKVIAILQNAKIPEK